MSIDKKRRWRDMVIICKCKDLMRELAILQLKQTRIDDIERIKELLKTIKL